MQDHSRSFTLHEKASIKAVRWWKKSPTLRLFSLQGHEKGQDLVEFALVLPVLILVVFGVLDLGRVFHAFITITNVAREGARFGTLYPDQIGAVGSHARAEAANGGLDPASLNVIVSCPSGCARGTALRVQARYTINLVMGFVLGPSLTVVRNAEMMLP